jgi:preprotein translocase subunit SecF
VEFFKIRRDIPFMENALVFNVISLVTFLAAVFFLFTRGLHLSVEFTGGTVMEVAIRSRPTSNRCAARCPAWATGRPGPEFRHRPRRPDPAAGAERREFRATERS